MFRFVIAAVLGLAVLAPVGLAQYYPESYRAYPAHQRAYPDDAEALVRSWYRRYLDREPDPSGLASWVGSLYEGNPPEAVLATILASEEYYRRAGGTAGGFVQKLFLDLTGRRPSRQEFDYWVQRAYYEDTRDMAYALLVRHPQSWSASPYDPRAGSPHDYDYRRPFSRYYRR